MEPKENLGGKSVRVGVMRYIGSSFAKLLDPFLCYHELNALRFMCEGTSWHLLHVWRQLKPDVVAMHYPVDNFLSNHVILESL